MGRADCILGVDPGVTGAFALLDAGTLRILHVSDAPTTKVRSGRTDKLRLDLHTCYALCQQSLVLGSVFALIEDVGGRANQRGMFAFGYTTGAMSMALAAAGIPYATVPPAVWKKRMRVPANKDAARQAASRLMPDAATQWARAKDDGRAEAALLAYYGATTQ
jgi:hypothetical protein